MKTDSQIQADVMQELIWDPRVSHEHIGVAVTDGIVALSGTIPSYIEKSAAERAAQRVAGVKAVVEKIEVKLPSLYEKDDLDIAEAVLNSFLWNVEIPDKLIKVSVENGWVKLTGEVEWNYQRNAAEKLVRSLTGVKGVSNNIILKTREVQAGVVKQKIEDALKREALREAKQINVAINGGTVTLSGKVHSFSEMNDAKLAAWSAPGVTKIENKLLVA
ncbi:MAG: BON domain-containing protein [Candidatus Saccharibacteria bacterium]|nr:BON domain-containing protein [Candidatus Saccharibacteria bacterium]